ncbi:tetratricopeptide repeat protein [Nitrosomonas communis]|uniref:Flp pilus assembly protein TadD, contains TPR repeats n=1 Tax=Nitrosomonas communis TaxID=44574 RepID=A0A1I4MQW6_9PROT|nr:tetratricopeptide repeat protein [Nitrosomonas communis]SFM05467.1 Flp pilus assembly protein TadD, contains TPR repeats [Nitrosomonas communis]
MTKTLTDILKEAGAFLEKRDYTNASTLYQEAMKLQPGNAAAAMGIAMIHNRTGQPEEALKILQGVWKTISSSKMKKAVAPKAAVLAQIGLAQQQLGRALEALQIFRQANALLPSTELTERIQKLENVIENPNTIEQLLIRASQLHRSGKLEEAVKVYHAALQINADHPEALHGLGLTLSTQKDLDGALPLLQQAIVLAPDRPDYYNDLGILFQERGEFEKAISFHKRALKIKADFFPAYINLGVAYKRLGKLDDAIAAYRQAIAIQPNSAAAHNNLGNLLRIQGDLVNARKELEQAIQLQPGYQGAIENLAALEQEAKQKSITNQTSTKPATHRKGKPV